MKTQLILIMFDAKSLNKVTTMEYCYDHLI